MKTATVRELRNDFGHLSKWLESGETVQIVKRGKPFARLMPEPKCLLRCTKGAVSLPLDIDDPVDVE